MGNLTQNKSYSSNRASLKKFYKIVKTCKGCKKSYGLDRLPDNDYCPICIKKLKTREGGMEKEDDFLP